MHGVPGGARKGRGAAGLIRAMHTYVPLHLSPLLSQYPMLAVDTFLKDGNMLCLPEVACGLLRAAAA